MNKKQIAFVALVFIIGFVFGSFAVTNYLHKSFRDAIQILLLEHRSDLEKRVFQAYSYENPLVAVWALENLADILRKHEEQVEQKDRELIQNDLILTYVRLAIMSKAAKKDQEYTLYISKAVALGKQINPDSPNTEEHLLDIVKNLDHNSIKKLGK